MASEFVPVIAPLPLGKKFSDFDLTELSCMKDDLKGKNIGIVIGRGQEFRDKNQKKVIYEWLKEEMANDSTDMITYGADYKKLKENYSVETSFIYEIISNLNEYTAIAVTNPVNLNSEVKYLASNTKYLISSEDESCWGGGTVGNPKGATKTTIDMCSKCNKIVLYVIDGGNVSAEELEIYYNMGVEIKMYRLDTPAVKKAKELGIKMVESDNMKETDLKEKPLWILIPIMLYIAFIITVSSTEYRISNSDLYNCTKEPEYNSYVTCMGYK